MIQYFKKHKTTLVLLLTTIVLIWVSSNRFWGHNRWHKILKSDATGYYAYLPAVIVYHDLSFSFFDKVNKGAYRNNYKYDYRNNTGNGVVNKYFAGVAFVQIPFYLAGHMLTSLSSGTPDGYSKWYLILFQSGALFYCVLGLFFFWKVLKLFKVGDSVSAWIIVAVLFGTNLYHYTVNESGMSHVYSFAFVNLFVWQALRYFRTGKNAHYYWAMAALGVITLIRPVNVLVLLSIPFLSGDFSTLKRGIKKLFKKPAVLMVGIFLFFIMVSIQLIIYKIETGNFIVYSYGKEGLNLLKPHFINFLFSYRKGFFVYTPMAFLSLFGAGYLLKVNKYIFFSWAGFLLIVIYVISSWWMWYYGGSFSSRVMVEYLTFFFIPLALWLSNTKYKKLLKLAMVILILVNLIQTYQYQGGYIHWSEMNKERYWNNFLRLDKAINHQRDW